MRYVLAVILATVAIFTFPSPSRVLEGHGAAWFLLVISLIFGLGAAWQAFGSAENVE